MKELCLQGVVAERLRISDPPGTGTRLETFLIRLSRPSRRPLAMILPSVHSHHNLIGAWVEMKSRPVRFTW